MSGWIIGEDLEGILDLLLDLREFICRKSDMEMSLELQIDEEEHLKKTADILVFATKGTFRFQKNAEGFAYISRSIALCPTTQNLLIRAGKYAESYQYAPAIEDYKRAIDLEKDSSKKAEIYVELVHCYIENKEYDQAKLYFQRALESYRIAIERNSGALFSSIRKLKNCID